jgi:hypothetical protein
LDYQIVKYSYGRPNFLNFIDHTIPGSLANPYFNEPSDKKLKFDPPFPEWLYSTCRAILDSKYYEYVMFEDMGFANVTRLTDFVYSWLGKFCVDEKTRHVR